MPREADHRHFKREFNRLCAEGILEWDEVGQILRLNPPPLDLVRGHIARVRVLDAEYWREVA